MSDERMSDSEALAHPAVITGPLVPLSQYRRLLAERDQLREEAERYRKALEEIDASGSVGPMAHKIASAALEPLPPSALRGATEDSTP